MLDESCIVIPSDVRLILTEAYLRRHSDLSVQEVAQQTVELWAKRWGMVVGTAHIDRAYDPYHRKAFWYVRATGCEAVHGIDRDTIDRLSQSSRSIRITFDEVPADGN